MARILMCARPRQHCASLDVSPGPLSRQRSNVRDIFGPEEYIHTSCGLLRACRAVAARTMSARLRAMRYGAAASAARSEGWWAVTDSNRRHPACKAGALPTELTARAACLARDAETEQGSLPRQRKGGARRRRLHSFADLALSARSAPEFPLRPGARPPWRCPRPRRSASAAIPRRD
jgi:hypothetical protein